jgi:hypothetical protein
MDDLFALFPDLPGPERRAAGRAQQLRERADRMQQDIRAKILDRKRAREAALPRPRAKKATAE